MYMKRYFFKETQTIFPGFDEYNVLNYQVFLIGIVICAFLDINIQREGQLVTSYSLKRDVNSCF
jgi:hypothetical protein